MHYNTFPQFKAGLLDAGLPKDTPNPKVDILFEHYKQARKQDSLTLGRLGDTQNERETRGTVFEGGKGQLLLTPKASGFDPKVSAQIDIVFGKKWSIWLNDAFILGGIHSHAVFHLVSDVKTLQGNKAAEFPFSVTQRELIGLVTFGYSCSAPHLKGTEYKCTQPQLADAATFRSYVDEMLSRVNRL